MWSVVRYVIEMSMPAVAAGTVAIGRGRRGTGLSWVGSAPSTMISTWIGFVVWSERVVVRPVVSVAVVASVARTAISTVIVWPAAASIAIWSVLVSVIYGAVVVMSMSSVARSGG